MTAGSPARCCTELLADFAAGALRPLPVRAFPLAEAADAFRFMAQARHIGKIVLGDGPRDRATSCRGATQPTSSPAGSAAWASRSPAGSWTGAHGTWCSWGGAAPPASARPIAGGARAAGAEVKVVSADVSRPDEVASDAGRDRPGRCLPCAGWSTPPACSTTASSFSRTGRSSPA